MTALYRNGRTAKNGEKIVVFPESGAPFFAVYYDPSQCLLLNDALFYMKTGEEVMQGTTASSESKPAAPGQNVGQGLEPPPDAGDSKTPPPPPNPDPYTDGDSPGGAGGPPV